MARSPRTSTTSWSRGTRSRSAAPSPPTSCGAASGPCSWWEAGPASYPLMAILRHRRRTMPELPMRLVYSVRSAEDVIYADELDDEALLTFTREPPAGWSGHTGRIDGALLEQAGIASATAFVCGSNGFVETASELLLEAGCPA